jgi:hypothetical protein
MKKHFSLRLAHLIVWVGLGLSHADTSAKFITERQIEYTVGELSVRETPTTISICKDDRVLLTSKIGPGGILDPEIHADESGVLIAGTRGIDLKTGKFVLVDHASTCGKLTPQDLSATHAARSLVVSPHLDKDGRITRYSSRTLNTTDCRQTARADIPPRLVDNLFELRASSSGWWLIGSQDATILTTSTGKHWQRLSPPQEVHNILTANWAGNKDFLILANKRSGSELLPTLYKTRNSGLTWVEIQANPANVPAYWFEARRQLAAATLQ